MRHERKVRALQGGEILFHAGETPTSLYRIRSGAIKRLAKSPRGTTAIREVLFPGDVFDLPELLSRASHLNDAVSFSLVRTEIEVLERADLFACRATLDEATRQQGVRDENTRRFQAAINSDSVQERTVLLMLLLAARGGTPVGSEQRLPFALAAGELAELAGTSASQAVRVLDELRGHGLFRQESTGATFLSTSRLLERCHCLPGSSIFQCWQRYATDPAPRCLVSEAV